jgi:glycosyltransferase involved in cell wall biosynthesis
MTPDATSPPDVSFVVIAYNEAPTIEGALASMVAQSADVSREIIVVDDGSRDATATIVESFAAHHPGLRLLRHSENRGRGAARHAGLEATRGAYIAFVDADIILPEHWLSSCLEAIDTADAVGGQAVPDGDVAFLYRHFKLEPKIVAATTVVTGNNGLYRRSVFNETTFDPNLREGEDVALNHALKGANARLMTIPDLHVRHEEHKSFLESIAWLYESGRGATRQLYRYREVRLPDLVLIGWLGSWIVALTGRRRRAARLALPVGYLLAGAAAHTWRSFHWAAVRPDRRIGATLADACLLGAYFAGRLRGILDLPTSR